MPKLLPHLMHISKVTVDEGRLVNRNDHIIQLVIPVVMIRFNLSDSEYGSLLPANKNCWSAHISDLEGW